MNLQSWTLVFGFIIGTVLGSFTKALADRSLTNRSFWGRSYCPHCKSRLRWYDLLPIVSYLILKGKCRYCQKDIGIEYPLVEVALGLLIGYLFFLSFNNFNFSTFNPPISLLKGLQISIFLLDLIFKIFFITILAVLFLTDIKKMFIPDRIVKPAIGVSLIYLILSTVLKIGYLYYSLSQAPLGKLLLPPKSSYFQRHVQILAEPLLWGILMAVLIGGFFMLLIIITRGKGMGGGDVKLGALIGLALGFPFSMVALMGSFFTGAILSLFLIFLGKKRFGQTIPFGPFLVLGSLVALFWGNHIINWYLHLTV